MTKGINNTPAPEGKEQTLFSRQQALARLGLAAACVYVAPLMMTLSEATAKSGSSGGAEGSLSSSGGSGDMFEAPDNSDDPFNLFDVDSRAQDDNI